jgi:DNA-binding NtrC family response regulator
MVQTDASMNEPKAASHRAQILVVEDSSVFREMQTLLLGQAGFAVSAHENPHSALAAAAKRRFDLVVIDYELPDMNGQEFMHALRKIQPEIAVVFVSGSLTLDLAIQLSSQGVAGIFNKPANPKVLLEKINETLARNAVRDTAARTGSGSPLPSAKRGLSRSPFSSPSPPAAGQLAFTPHYIFGTSEAFREFTHQLWRVRDFRSVLLLQGEEGSPFELFARELAEVSIFREGPTMICPADEFEPRRLIQVLAPSLLSHDAGTLIVTGVEGFTAAQQKTLSDLTTGRDVFLPFARRFRLVLAATSELSEHVDNGAFDETLFYKISSLSLSVPSLREMRGDIVTNAVRILAQLGEAEPGAARRSLSAEAAEWIEAHDWPGNYAELAGALKFAVAGAKGGELAVADLMAGLQQAADAGRAAEQLRAPIAIAGDRQLTPGTRPPFPLASDLTADAALKEAADEPASPASSRKAPPIAAPLRTPAPSPALNAQSLFRPASSTYSFSERLKDTLSAAEACGVS